MRQQLVDARGRLGGQPLEYVAQVGERVEPVHLGRLDQAHDRCGPFSRSQTAGKQPVGPAQRDRAGLILAPVVVQRGGAVLEVVRERGPAPQAVVDGARWPIRPTRGRAAGSTRRARRRRSGAQRASRARVSDRLNFLRGLTSGPAAHPGQPREGRRAVRIASDSIVCGTPQWARIGLPPTDGVRIHEADPHVAGRSRKAQEPR